jgi:hypothetical protein
MNREEFEHVVRAAASIVHDQIVIVGSQAILGAFPTAPSTLLRSQELDVYPREDPDRAAEIDGAIGDGSMFHRTYGYYAHGVGPETVHAPAGWQGRLERVELPGLRQRDGSAVGWYLEVHDLVLAKLVAGREHDIDFALEALRAGLVDLGRLERGLELMSTSDRERAEPRLLGLRSS